MSKKKSSSLDVTGMGIEDILNMDYDDIATMGEVDLKKITNRLVSASNKRIRRLEARGLESLSRPLQGKQEGFRFSIEGKDRNQTLQTFGEAKNFLNSASSSVRGIGKISKEVMDKWGIDIEDEDSPIDYKDAWKMYREFAERNPSLVAKHRDSTRWVNMIMKRVGGKVGKQTWTKDKLENWIDNHAKEVKERIRQRQASQDESVFNIKKNISD